MECKALYNQQRVLHPVRVSKQENRFHKYNGLIFHRSVSRISFVFIHSKFFAGNVFCIRHNDTDFIKTTEQKQDAVYDFWVSVYTLHYYILIRLGSVVSVLLESILYRSSKIWIIKAVLHPHAAAALRNCRAADWLIHSFQYDYNTA